MSSPIVRPGGPTTVRTASRGCDTPKLPGSSASTTRITSTCSGWAAVSAALARKRRSCAGRPRVGTMRENVGRVMGHGCSRRPGRESSGLDSRGAATVGCAEFHGGNPMSLFTATVAAALAAPAADLPTAPPPRPAADTELARHLASWERATGDGVKSLRATLALTRTEAVVKQEKRYSGTAVWMRPNLAVLRMKYDGDKTGNDYVAYVCDGKAAHEYVGLQKSETRWPLPARFDPLEAFAFKCLTGAAGPADRARFRFTLVQAGRDEVEIGIVPLNAADKAEFAQARVVLNGPDAKDPYTPAALRLVLPNGDTEVWKFSDFKINPPGVDETAFRPARMPGFTYREVPPLPPGTKP
ncbi:MAG: hypothetical protein C0501_07655 [Isosphaera sp.]|nr:hypothetical protein [Isosphaera sp.]